MFLKNRPVRRDGPLKRLLMILIVMVSLAGHSGGPVLSVSAASSEVPSEETAMESTAQPTAASTVETANLSDPAENDNLIDESPVIAAALSAGLFHSAMINYDGLLYIWGDNTYGQLGLGALDYSDTPQLLSFPGQVVSVSLGTYHSLAVLADGSVWAWGRNAFGQLGTGNTDNTAVPVQLNGLPPISQVAAGALHSLALGTDGSVWAWGSNSYLQIGDVPSESITDSAGKMLGTRCATPTRIVGGGAAAVAAGGQFSLFLDENGQVFAWGDNQYGQLGDGTTQSHARPVQVSGLTDIVSIAAGFQHGLAISRQAGQDALMVWGDNSLGQLGFGSDLAVNIFRSLPERLDTTGDQDPVNDRITRIAAGYSQSAAIVPSDGPDNTAAIGREKLLVWGNNASGQLALGKSGSQNRPTAISGTFNEWTGSDFLPFDSVAFGGYHLLVLSSKGLLAAAGRGDRGQLGNHSVLDRKTLTAVSMPDVLRPAWVEGCSLSARISGNGDLVVRWPAAQDNRSVAGYRVRLRRGDGQLQEIDAGNQLTWTFAAVNARQAYEILVMVYDADSVSAEDQTLSRLAAWIRPEGAPGEARLEDYFSDWNESDWQVDYLPNNWHPDPQGLLRPLEMPWDVSTIYDTRSLPHPADWRVFIQTAWVTAILLLLSLLVIYRRQTKSKQPSS